MQKVCWFILLLCSTSWGFSQNPLGTWKTIDDKTGEAKSHIEIYSENDALHGKISKLLQSDEDTLCDKCPGQKNMKPVLGMVILENLKPFKGYWKKGKILDPESGNEYGCSMWFEEEKNNELKVRGKHWTGLFRTQTWYRVR